MGQIIYGLDLRANTCQSRFEIKKHCISVFSRLRYSCNLMIAADSLCAIVGYFGTIVPYVVLLGASHSISYSTCFYVIGLPMFAVQFSSMLPLAIGVDRLLHVTFPIWFLRQNKKKKEKTNTFCINKQKSFPF